MIHHLYLAQDPTTLTTSAEPPLNEANGQKAINRIIRSALFIRFEANPCEYTSHVTAVLVNGVVTSRK
jgi:hypothetical protein